MDRPAYADSNNILAQTVQLQHAAAFYRVVRSLSAMLSLWTHFSLRLSELPASGRKLFHVHPERHGGAADECTGLEWAMLTTSSPSRPRPTWKELLSLSKLASRRSCSLHTWLCHRQWPYTHDACFSALLGADGDGLAHLRLRLFSKSVGLLQLHSGARQPQLLLLRAWRACRRRKGSLPITTNKLFVSRRWSVAWRIRAASDRSKCF